METHGFFCRVQAYEGYKDKVVALGLAYDLVVAMEHKGEQSDPNPHYHIVVKTKIENQTFRKRMKVLFDKGKGNGHMSIKPWDGNDDAISYMLHEDPDAPFMVKKGLTEEAEARCRARNLAVKDIVAKAKDKASWKLEERADAHFKGQQGLSDWDIARWMMLEALRTGMYPPAPHHLKGMVTRVQFKLCDGDERLEEQMVERFLGQVYPIR